MSTPADRTVLTLDVGAAAMTRLDELVDFVDAPHRAEATRRALLLFDQAVHLLGLNPDAPPPVVSEEERMRKLWAYAERAVRGG